VLPRVVVPLPIFVLWDATKLNLIDYLNNDGTAPTAVVTKAARCNARAAFCCRLRMCCSGRREGLGMTGRGKLWFAARRPKLGWMVGHNDQPGHHPGLSPSVPVALSAVAAFGCLVWIAVSSLVGAHGQSVPPTPQAGISGQTSSLLNPSITPVQIAAVTPESAIASTPSEAQPVVISPLDRLSISSQSWRRSGLGSNALVTFTLRNGNDFAVKDIGISCAFTRKDGSHLTDRARLITEVVGKGRKTFARMHIGFVNVNADKAKCSLVTASRA
jgi:hypothetical protein